MDKLELGKQRCTTMAVLFVRLLMLTIVSLVLPIWFSWGWQVVGTLTVLTVTCFLYFLLLQSGMKELEKRKIQESG
ncbi:MAG: hypothetical protein FWE95_05280 [Planctomycetaceae bacterium]|nr:hypothetical protein [Planctomycetaceae bacterium]